MCVGEDGRGAWCLLLHHPVSSPISCPLYFALNGLSKDPLSRAAESFLHFKKKKKERKVAVSFGSIFKCVRRCSIAAACGKNL